MTTLAALLTVCCLQSDNDAGARIDTAIQRLTRGGFWGVVLVAREGKPILSKGYGFADYATRPNDPRTFFEIASSSKQFTAAAVLKLESEGKLKTTDTLDRIFEDVPDDKKSITIHHLLTHTSGLREDIGLPYSSKADREELVRTMLRSPLACEPGTKFSYCNFGYALLAAVIEVASGRTFEAYLQEAIFKPAGLTDTGFILDRSLDAGRMSVRLSPDSTAWTAANWFWGWGYRGMGGVVTTAEDLLKWDRALRSTTVLDGAAKEKLFKPFKDGYACGWLVEATDGGSRKASHAGSVAGYQIQLVHYLDEDVFIAVLSNGGHDVYAIEKAITAHLFPKPAIEMTLGWTPYQPNERKAVILPKAIRWSVTVNGEIVLLHLMDSASAFTAVSIRVPKSYGRKILMELEAAIEGKEPDEAESEAGIYLASYELKGTKLTLSQGLEIRILPKYQGVDGSGRQIIDRRPTFVVQDNERQMWPVMMRMNLKDARGLADQLKPTLE